MPFQSTVFFQQGAGVPGELYTDGPYRSQSFIINSSSAALNIIGATAFSITSQGNAAAGNTTGSLVFAGILATPKVQPLQGTVAGGTLAASLTLPNYAQAELITMGSLWVTLPSIAAIGDYVIFNNTTGVLSTITPGTTIPTGYSFANAVVDYFTVSAAGLAVITMTNTLNNP